MAKDVERGRWPMTTSAYAKGLLLALGIPIALVILYLLRAQ